VKRCFIMLEVHCFVPLSIYADVRAYTLIVKNILVLMEAKDD